MDWDQPHPQVDNLIVISKRRQITFCQGDCLIQTKILWKRAWTLGISIDHLNNFGQTEYSFKKKKNRGRLYDSDHDPKASIDIYRWTQKSPNNVHADQTKGFWAMTRTHIYIYISHYTFYWFRYLTN